jgi:hypothetical protein
LQFINNLRNVKRGSLAINVKTTPYTLQSHKYEKKGINLTLISRHILTGFRFQVAAYKNAIPADKSNGHWRHLFQMPGSQKNAGMV